MESNPLKYKSFTDVCKNKVESWIWNGYKKQSCIPVVVSAFAVSFAYLKRNSINIV